MLTGLLVLTGFFFMLAVGGVISDKVLPRSRVLNRFIHNLPMNWM